MPACGQVLVGSPAVAQHCTAGDALTASLLCVSGCLVLRKAVCQVAGTCLNILTEALHPALAGACSHPARQAGRAGKHAHSLVMLGASLLIETNHACGFVAG